MASIRRTLSPVPRPGTLPTGEAVQVASSPLSRSSSNNQNNLPHSSGVLPSSLGFLDYTLYKAQNLILGTLSMRSSRPFDRSKVKSQSSWRRSTLHFLACFMVGVFLGFTPFVSLSLSANFTPDNNRQQAFDFGVQKNKIDGSSSSRESSASEPQLVSFELKEGIVSNHSVSESLFGEDSNTSLSFDKLLIVVTPTRARWPLQAHYVTRLAHTLRLVPPPLLWIVVEMNSLSAQTADLLRGSGVMYRHLVCATSKNSSTEATNKNAMMRNVALSHVETHRLDGILYFADGDGVFSSELFQQMRQISRFGTWPVAELAENQGNALLQGPICNGSEVIGWHLADMEKRNRRFHAEMSGFAFNSSIIWDARRWHRPTLEAIRQIVAVEEDLQASAFIEQIVEDESQMECLAVNGSTVMTWHRATGSSSYPGDWTTSYNSLGSVFPLA